MNSISWVGPGWDPIYNENGPFLLLFDCFSAIAIVVWVVLGPLRHFGTLLFEGPQGLVPSTSGIISPALTIRPKYSTEMHQNTSFCAELNGEHAGEGFMPLQ